MIDLTALVDEVTLRGLVTILIGAISVYATTRCIYLLYFHPLARFPGPKIGAVSNIWYGYHWLSGRYPWAIENVLREYGDAVRIAPNELVFITPQATIDIYSPHEKNLEVFVKTDFNNRGKNLGGIIWEEDAVLHRQVAKKVAPAFSNRSLRKMEPEIHKYLDYFVEKMGELGGAVQGVELVEWTNWLAYDMSADLTWNEKMHQMRDLKNTGHLDVMLSFNKFVTIMQVFKRFPLLDPLKYIWIPFSKIMLFFAIEQTTRNAVRRRIRRKGDIEHIDFFEYILPADTPEPTDAQELVRLGSTAVQLMFAGFGPMSDWFYATLFYLLEEPECCTVLTEEIRTAFETYDSIQPGALASLPYLHACLEESLRMLPSNNTGLPRTSPGTMIDGQYVPKGTTVQTSIFALARSSRYFHDPLRYRPQRWLSSDHRLYDAKFSKDNLRGLYSFSLGPRGCPGKEMAWVEARLFTAKLLWKFDVQRITAQCPDIDVSLHHFGFFIKPEMKIRFAPVARENRELCNGV